MGERERASSWIKGRQFQGECVQQSRITGGQVKELITFRVATNILGVILGWLVLEN